MKSNYYLVGISAAKHWTDKGFIYSSEAKIPTGTLVKVPFGKTKKIGVTLRKTEKPSFNTKPILEIFADTLPEKTLKFIEWYREYYAAQYGQVFSQILPAYVKLKKTTGIQLAHSGEITLSSAQKKALQDILQDTKPKMLHGYTGAGKTRIYTKILQDQIGQGKDCLLLYPEIGLTTQLVNAVSQHVPVLYFHSQLSDKERATLWATYIQANRNPVVVMGTRSALFLPHRNLGCVIIDEAHEQTYKQQNDIRYNSLMVGGALAKIHNAQFLAASATPPITETELIKINGGRIVCLHEQAIKSVSERQITLIDSKDQTQFKKHSLISDKLLDKIAHNLEHNLQTMLYINRRGTAKLQLCTECGWQATCKKCDLPVTYHHDSHTLLCHTCGTATKPQSICPDCSHETNLKSYGSKAFVTEIQKLFPSARIARFDSDNTKDETLQQKYEELHNGKIDILIGTQQIIKGLDLPNLATIGLLHADLSLNFPDYTSEERTFQLVNQAIGRVGRGHTAGSVILQSFQPKSSSIRFAISGDWHNMSIKELEQRKIHEFPPYTFALKLLFRNRDATKARKQAENALKNLQSTKQPITIQGPITAFHFKQNNHYIYQLLVRSRSRSALLTSIKHVRESPIIDMDPSSFL